jgi:CRISPR-associated protein Csb1
MTAGRTVLKVVMEPVAGSLIQPTGFPDLGACTFGDDMILVESAQSMANWLEGTTWDMARAEPVPEVAMLPYLRVVDPEREYLTSSRVEAHRLASAYIMDGKIDGTDGKEGRDWLPGQLGLVRGKPLDYRTVARACFQLDPVSLVHGVFFAQQKWPWQPKIARALTSFIEASGAKPAVSGGVKRDCVLNEAQPGDTAKGYG